MIGMEKLSSTRFESGPLLHKKNHSGPGHCNALKGNQIFVLTLTGVRVTVQSTPEKIK